MNKVLVIGCGGIGSFFIREIYQLFENGVKGTENLELTMVDEDKVEEKNLRYQNFDIEDLGNYKAESLNKRYPFFFENKFIKSTDDLKEKEVIILAVDNGKVRKMVYEFCEKNNIYFIDMRSEGRAITIFTKHKSNDLKTLLSTIDPEAPSTSCQLKFELKEGIIQVGNRIVANIGVQMLLNYLRNQKNIAKFTQRF